MTDQPLVAFDVRPDEIDFFTACERKTGCEIRQLPAPLNLESLADMPETDIVSILGNSAVNRHLMAALADRSVSYLSTRTVGFDHIDLDAARRYGIRVGHVSYPPNSVAEYTIMLILMTLRRMKLVMQRAEIQDFALAGSQGKEIGQATIGIIGTGRIGALVAQLIKPFGARILAYDPYPKETLQGVVEYVDFDTLISQSTLVTLHAPAAPENRYLLNAESIARMQRGVLIINCSRGELIDSEALISALETGHVGGGAFDVLEDDLRYFHQDIRFDTITNRNLVLLRSFPNVLVTPHIAFYTSEVVSAMVSQSVDSLLQLRQTGSSELLVGGT